MQWLSEGDRNTSFFHISTVKHKKRNRINKLHNAQGEVFNSPPLIGLVVADYFMKAYEAPVEAPNLTLDNLLLDSLLNLISQIDNVGILSTVTLEEVKLATFSMGAYKAPGPDGFPPTFSHTF